jgi:hypothetical protein
MPSTKVIKKGSIAISLKVGIILAMSVAVVYGIGWELRAVVAYEVPMSSILPLRSSSEPDGDREPRLVDLDEDTAEEVFEALSSATARTMFMRLHKSPATSSDLAEAADTPSRTSGIISTSSRTRI